MTSNMTNIIEHMTANLDKTGALNYFDKQVINVRNIFAPEMDVRWVNENYMYLWLIWSISYDSF